MSFVCDVIDVSVPAYPAWDAEPSIFVAERFGTWIEPDTDADGAFARASEVCADDLGFGK